MGKYDAYRNAERNRIHEWTSPRTGDVFKYRQLELSEFLVANQGNLPQSLLATMSSAQSGEITISGVADMITFHRAVCMQGVLEPELVEDEKQADFEISIPVAALAISEARQIANAILSIDAELREAIASFPDEEEAGVDAIENGKDVGVQTEPVDGVVIDEPAGA